MGGDEGLAWPDSLGTIHAALGALADRVRDHEVRYAVLLRGPQPCGERAAALAATGRRNADAVLTKCNELTAQAEAAAAEVATAYEAWVTRCDEWQTTTAGEAS